ncbi:hypothetical protein Svir_13940 [Saccharomonospora viridis DSM 43017]|uniref:Uncharacterized protein n=1 Tax=Saccharomonospora viridis (strain ATCC 15386 / DSM 43017 / JCM 3036 / CCUG 5913 / NBRC 12207 / NCIMB 9602 / P101) TaxID=471857 RepID=C7MQD8_SACVD|nr:hypothetical protein Svir_13940 [Saccharomonospora viridis DSM 43017]
MAIAGQGIGENTGARSPSGAYDEIRRTVASSSSPVGTPR